MNLNWTLLALAIVVVCATTTIVNANDLSEDGAKELVDNKSARGRFVMPKLFDFNNFKQLFKKHYNSIIEELARKKLFLARAFQAFLSAVGYKHRKASSYLSLNHMSDWTPEEALQTNLRSPPFADGIVPAAEVPGASAELPPVADLEDIERKLSEIVEERGSAPGFSEIASELKQQPQSRSKRSPSTATRSLNLDDLVPSEGDERKERVATVGSNNPNYEAPELVSFGFADDWLKNNKWLNEDQIALIGQLPGAQFVADMVDSAASLLIEPVPAVPINLPELPDEVFIDHRRESNCFLEPRNQGKCGSCYIFSTIALYEWLHCRATGKLVPFSEQYAIDCGERAELKDLNGCDGGTETDVAKFVNEFGLELLNNYPYLARAGTCPYSEATDLKAMGYLRVSEPGLVAVRYSKFDEVLKVSPILIGVEVPSNFHYYGGGVDLDKDCLGRNRYHAMVLIGSGREDGLEYWLMRNSYSTRWGEKGYYKLSKSSKCIHSEQFGFVSRATFPTVEEQKEPIQLNQNLFSKYFNFV